MPDQADTGHRAHLIAGGRRATEKVLYVKVLRYNEKREAKVSPVEGLVLLVLLVLEGIPVLVLACQYKWFPE